MRYVGLPFLLGYFLLSCFLLFSVSAANATVTYQIYAAPGAIQTEVNGINLSGTVVGSYFDSQVDSHGFIGDASGNITTFDVPGVSSGYGQGTYATAINDAGTVIGKYSTSSSAYRGFLRDAAGNFTTFDVPGLTMTQSPYERLSGINNAGQVVGIGLGTPGYEGFVGVPGAFSVFTPNSGYTYYISINSAGQVAGTFVNPTGGAFHGFSRDTSGNITTFDIPGAMETQAGYGTFVSALSDKGLITGSWTDTNYHDHGYVRNASGTITSFDVVGATNTGAGPVNANGVIVGEYTDSAPENHAFVRYPSGVIVPFDGPKHSIESGYGTIPTGINRHGQVCGYYGARNNTWYGFVRTPPF